MRNDSLVIHQGHSLLVTIPADFVRRHGIVRGYRLKRTVEGNRIILEVDGND